MSTFLLFALIFIPFVWLIVRALRFTDQSIGESSPLKTVVRYRVTARQYFSQSGFVASLLMGLTVLPLTAFLLVHLETITSPWYYAVTLGMVVAVGWFSYQLYGMVQLRRHYWLLMKDVTLTLDPGTRTITVERQGYQTHLHTARLAQIDYHGADPSGPKLFSEYGYYRFTCHNGQVVVVNNTPAFLHVAVEEYFKSVPQHEHSHRIPWPPHSAVTAPFPNFAS